MLIIAGTGQALRRSLFSLLVAWTAFVATSAAADRFPATGGQPTAVLAGTHYLNASDYLGRHGLAMSWVAPGQRARFANAWTTIELEAEKREIRYNGLRLFLGDAALLHRNGLWVSRLDAEKLLGPLLRPALFAGTARLPRTIVIDAGHGGQDTGTRNHELKLDEKNFTLDVARQLAALLEREGYTVVMTRTDDRFVALAERAEIAKRAQADLFVSIHFNAVEKSPAVRGTETFILTPRFQRSTGEKVSSQSDRAIQQGNVADAWNAVLGFHLQRQLLERLGTFDRGLKRARFAVLRLVECPAALVEAGYLSNNEEAAKLATSEYRTAIAEAVANGIAAYTDQIRAAQK